MALLVVVVVVAATTAAAAEPGLLRQYTVPIYAPAHTEGDGSAPDDPQMLKRGSPLVLWSIACEPSTSGTTFDNPTTSACVPARLVRLPDSAYSPSGNGTRQQLLKDLARCMKLTVQKAPDDVVAAATRMDDAFLEARLAKEKTPTMTLIARASYEEGESVELSWNTSGFTLPAWQALEPMTLYLVDAPDARAVDRALKKGKTKAALAIARAAYQHARQGRGDEKLRALGNLVLAAALAGDVSALPGDDEIAAVTESGDVTEAGSWALNDLDALQGAKDGSFRLQPAGGDGC